MRPRSGLPLFLLVAALAACVSKGDTIINQDGPAGGTGGAGGGLPSGGAAGEQAGGAGVGGPGGAGGPSAGQGGSGQAGSGAAGLCVETPDSCNADATRLACGRCGADEGCHSLLDQVDRCGGCDRQCEQGTSCKEAKAAYGCSSKELVMLSTTNRNLDQISAPLRLANGSVFVFEGPDSTYTMRRYSKGAGSKVLDAASALGAVSDEQNVFVLSGASGVIRVGDDGSSATVKNLVPRLNFEASAGGGIETIALGNQIVAWSEAYSSSGTLQWCAYATNRDTGAILSGKSPVDGCADNALLGLTGDYIMGISVSNDDWVAISSSQKITTIQPSVGTTIDIPLGDTVPYVCWGDIALSESDVFFFGGPTNPKQIPTGSAIGCSIYRSKRDGTQATPELFVDVEQGGIGNNPGDKGFLAAKLRYHKNFVYFLTRRLGSPDLLGTVLRIPAKATAPVAKGLFTSVVDPTYQIEDDFSITNETMTFQGRVGDPSPLFSVRSVSLK